MSSPTNIPPTQMPPVTSLLDMPGLALRAGVGRVLVKCESERALGNFKSLGGRLAGQRALARHPAVRRLICASDGNHGLAVAAAAQDAGAEARIYLPAAVPEARAKRIRDLGGQIVRVAGTYDVAVGAAAAAALRGEGLLIADTTQDLDDPVIADVMAGYRVISDEISLQLGPLGATLTHLFVQAGVGGLAAALTEGLASHLDRPPLTVVVEPETCACVAAALVAGEPRSIPGDLHTSAEMLSCGLASAPAVRRLIAHGARAMTATEADLIAAPARLRGAGGPASTPTGAAGVAGLLSLGRAPQLRSAVDLTERSTVLLVVTESG